MRFVIFTHSLLSDWNHGNAHFLRGIATELVDRGHDVRIFEPRGGWSLSNLLRDHGEEPLADFRLFYPHIGSTLYDKSDFDISEALKDASVAIVHEWNSHDLVRRIGEYRAHHPGLRLYFHDTHHRSVTDPGAMSRYDLSAYDGVLAYGRVIADVYRRSGWLSRHGRGTKLRIPAYFIRGLATNRRATWCGSEIGATVSGRMRFASSSSNQLRPFI